MNIMVATLRIGRGVLAVLFLGLAASAQGRPLADFHAHCTFADGDVRLDLHDSEGLYDLLFAHADGHGWRLEPGGPDFVDATRSARCPTQLLDEMAASAPVKGSSGFAELLAKALERNGRGDDGLALFVQVRERVQQIKQVRNREIVLSKLSEQAARLAAHTGRWEAAREYAEGWTSSPGCGTCSASQTCQQRALVARSLYELGRFEEAIEVVRDTVGSEWTRDVRLFEIWIDCDLALERASSADEAIGAIRAQVADADWFCERALESWRVAHAPRPTQIEQLGVLAQWHSELALPLVLSLDATQIAQAMSAFDVEEGGLRHHALAELLADVGYPEVEVSLDRARRAPDPAVAKSTLNFIQGKFEEGKKRWSVLSRSGR